MAFLWRLACTLFLVSAGCSPSPHPELPDGGMPSEDGGGESPADAGSDAGQGAPDAGAPSRGARCNTTSCTSYRDLSGTPNPTLSCGGQVCTCSGGGCIQLKVGQQLTLQRAPSGTNPTGYTATYLFDEPGCFTVGCHTEVNVVP